MKLYKKFVDELVMNKYNKLVEDGDRVLFDSSRHMSGIRSAVNIMVFSLIAFVVLLPSHIDIFFIWLFLCSYVYKKSVESKIDNAYPYLEVGDMLGLSVNYLIMIPVAIGIHFVFYGGHWYLVNLIDLNQIEAFIVRVSMLLTVWVFYMFLFRDSKWDGRNKDWESDFIAQNQETEKEIQKNGSYDDLVKRLKNLKRTEKLKGKFKLPRDIRGVEDIKTPVFTKKRLNGLIEWILQTSKDKERSLNLINSLIKSKKLSVVIPEVVVEIIQFDQESGEICLPFLGGSFISIYTIMEKQGGFAYSSDDNKQWVDIMNNPTITSEAMDGIFGECAWIEWSSMRDESRYLKDEDLYIPYVEGFEDFYDQEYRYPLDDSENLYCTQEAKFWKQDILINGDKFRFKKDEKDYLVALLLASYKPRLLNKIKERLK